MPLGVAKIVKKMDYLPYMLKSSTYSTVILYSRDHKMVPLFHKKMTRNQLQNTLQSHGSIHSV